jgi:3-hydroxyisobutyrate dehydrogenase-like beta-hydroxyacid dehydrogenase
MTREPVTVIGLGPMGQAMAGVLLKAGHPVTVWNRTPARAETLVKAGAALAPTPAEAVTASRLTILSLTDYAAMYSILNSPDSTPSSSSPHSTPNAVSGLLAGRDLVNLSSDTPDASRKAADWATARGARFLTGGVMVPAPAIGAPGAYTYYSGPSPVLTEHEPALRAISETRYLGADPGLAQLFYQAQLDVFLTGLAALLHATALVTAAGVPAADFLPDAMQTLTEIPAMIGSGAELAAELEAGRHPGDLSTTLMMGATADHILRTSDSSGVDRALPAAVKSLYDRAIAAGHGTHDWTSLYEVIKA